MQSYEPMSLSSPITTHQPFNQPYNQSFNQPFHQSYNQPYAPHSPYTPHSSTTTPHPSSPKSRFQEHTPRLLPSYLMGDYPSRSRSFLHVPSTNPSTTPTQQPTYLPTNHPSSYERPRRQDTGPPIQTLEQEFSNSRTANTLNQSGPFDSPLNNEAHNYLINKSADSFMSPIAMSPKDPTYSTTDSSTLDHCWVTVFGFPNDTTSFILQEFSQLGNVVKHIIPQTGNWIHLLYENKIQARRAIYRNGRVLGGTVMVGVVECSDQSVFNSNTHNNTLKHSIDVSNGRALDKALNAGPTKNSSGLISKTLDYVFGW